MMTTGPLARSLRIDALLLPFALCALCACSDPPQEVPADDKDTASVSDAALDAGPKFGKDGTSADVGVSESDTGGPKSDWVVITFDVDDSANKTYTDADIYWTGSFAWDEKTGGIITPETSWLPEERAWPPLYDDGPISEGGHEREGAKKGDSIFSTQVKIKTDEDIVIEYGALNEASNWMWVGPNGVLELKKGDSGIKAAKTLVLPKFGDVDIKLELELAKLHKNFLKWSTKTHKFFVKGTMNTWTPVQLLDDGKSGDAKADDGILTYVHSTKLGVHDGLVSVGDEVQFVYVTTTGDTRAAAGQEYKGSTAAYPDGITAYTNTGPGKAWAEVEIKLLPDSKGKFKNTAIIVPSKSPDPGCTPPCTDGKVCEAGKCVIKQCTPACETWQSCLKGKCEDKACDPGCEAWQTCAKGKCADKPCDPACKAGDKCDKAQCVNDFDACSPKCKAGFECVALKCVEKKCDPSCGTKQKCEGGKCIDLLDVTKVEPLSGPLSGGTKITVTGQGFAAPAKVNVGGKACDKVFVKDTKHIECETPKGDNDGKVAVEVEVGGKKVELKDAFTYKPLPKPTVLLIEPTKLAVDEGAEIKGLKAIVKVAGFTNAKGALADLKVEFGYGKYSSTDPLKRTHPTKTTGADAWKWVAAKFLSEVTAKGEETWTADLGKLPLGEWAYTARATYGGNTVVGDSDGSDSGGSGGGFSLKKVGVATVQKAATGPVITGFSPPWSTTKGTTVTILGKNLKADFKVKLVSAHPTGANWPFKDGKDVKAVAGGLSVAMPAQPPGKSSVVLTPPNLPDVMFKEPLYIVPWGKPTLDGTPSFGPGAVDDWDPSGTDVLGQNTKGSAWDAAKNNVTALLVNVDKDNLYIGVAGTVEAKNAIVVYLDIDYGAAGGGTQNPKDLTDSKDAVDNAISAAMTCTDASFGVDYALATIGMGSFTSGKLAESTAAGWRNLKKVGDFGWETAPVHAKTGKGLEASIPLKTLFPAGIPKAGTTLGFVVAVVNAAGSAVPDNAKVPEQGSGKATVIDTVVTLRIFPPN